MEYLLLIRVVVYLPQAYEIKGFFFVFLLFFFYFILVSYHINIKKSKGFLWLNFFFKWLYYETGAWKHCLLPWYHLWYSPDIVSTAVRVTSSTTSRPLCQGQRSDVCQARQARSPTLWFSTLCKSVHLVPVKTSDAELMDFWSYSS